MQITDCHCLPRHFVSRPLSHSPFFVLLYQSYFFRIIGNCRVVFINPAGKFLRKFDHWTFQASGFSGLSQFMLRHFFSFLQTTPSNMSSPTQQPRSGFIITDALLIHCKLRRRSCNFKLKIKLSWIKTKQKTKEKQTVIKLSNFIAV